MHPKLKTTIIVAAALMAPAVTRGTWATITIDDSHPSAPTASFSGDWSSSGYSPCFTGVIEFGGEATIAGMPSLAAYNGGVIINSGGSPVALLTMLFGLLDPNNTGGPSVFDCWFYTPAYSGWGGLYGSALSEGFPINNIGAAGGHILDIGLNGHSVSLPSHLDVYVTTVPEPTTMIAGVLLLLPFGASALRMLRKRQVA